MQASQTKVIITVVISALVIIGAIFYAIGQIPEVPEITIPSVPTAAEIAAAISIPATESGQLQEIWDEIYEDEVNALERAARRECEREFDFDDVEDLFDDVNVSSIRFEDHDADDDDYVINDLGLDDEDDREVTITGEFIVSYILDEGQQTRVNDKVHGVCVVTSDDGDLEADLTLSL